MVWNQVWVVWRTIAALNLSTYRLISLAACETGITGKDDQSEYIGLSSAFLKAKAQNILSTLWQVSAFESAWFTIRFYQIFLETQSPAIALQTTQTWFQTTPIADFQTWLHSLKDLKDLEKHSETLNLTRELRIAANVLQERQGTIAATDRPYYAHPYYWAAFIITG